MILADKTDAKASITGVGTKNLKYGLNTFKIVVTSEAGNKKEYVLKITRKDDRSNVNTLKSLKLSSGTINFKSDTTTYSIKVSKDIDKISIDSELTNAKSKYVDGFGNREVSLKEGENAVLIKVMAENESVKTYTLNIIRGEIQMDPNDKSNAYIQGITIANYNINFSKDVFEYNLQINNESSLNIVVQMENGNASYEILNNENLKDGSQIIINTTSSNGDNKLEYKINISNKQSVIDDNKNNDVKDDSNDMMGYYIGVGTCLIGLIALISAIVYCKKKA